MNWFYFMYCIWACLVLYICMTCCRWHDRIPSMFRLYLLSIVAHPFPSFPVYICRSPVASRAGPTSFDVQRSIGLRRYLSVHFVYCGLFVPLVTSYSHIVYLQLYLDCKWVATDWCGSTCFSYSVSHFCLWYYYYCVVGCASRS